MTTKNNFVRKHYTKEEINIIVADQLEKCITPICLELGKVIEGLQQRIVDLEVASNAMIEEMKRWKKDNERSIQ